MSLRYSQPIRAAVYGQLQLRDHNSDALLYQLRFPTSADLLLPPVQVVVAGYDRLAIKIPPLGPGTYKVRNAVLLKLTALDVHS